MKRVHVIIIAVFTLFIYPAYGQQEGNVIDEVVAVVGNTPVLRSECDIEFAQAEKEISENPVIRCILFQQLLVKKMLLHQALIDSLPMTNERIEANIDNKIRFYERQLGSREALEKYLGKSVAEYKKDVTEKVREQMLVEDMENKILSNVKVSPQEVRSYFSSIPKDSLPLVNSELEVAQIIIKPKISSFAKEFAREQAEDIRKRALKGENFALLASLFSEDPGSKLNGGLLDEFGRNEMVPEFERAAFKLKKDSISKVIETSFGFHIIKLENRRGERIVARHILVRPKTTSADLEETRMKLDTILNLILTDSLTWCEAAKKYSEDKETKGDCGFFTDPATGSSKVSMEDLDREIAQIAAKLKPGDISDPEIVVQPDNTKIFRIVYLKSETKPHTINMVQDYQKLQLMAQEHKKQSAIEKWVDKKRKETYIRIDNNYITCEFSQEWATQKP